MDCGYYDGDRPKMRSLVHFAKQVDFEHFASKMKTYRSNEDMITEPDSNEKTNEGIELVDLYYCTVTLASIALSGGIFSK